MKIKKSNLQSHSSCSHFLTITLLFICCAMFSQIANAVPAFARQTNNQCAACHFQSFPALNEFGRAFRANGYIMDGVQEKIEGDNNLSLPATLNASVIAKLRYQLDGSVDGSRGEIQWPDEAALLIGGRLAKNAGFIMELGMGPQGADTGTGALTCSNNADASTCTADTGSGDATGNFLSAKVHFNIGDHFAIIPFSTDGLGVGYGFELMNTGAQRSQRPIENRTGFSAGQILGTASGGATGIALVYQTPEFFINYSHWTPTWGNVHANVAGGLAHYLRAAYMPRIGDWDTGIGISTMFGSVETGPTDAAILEFLVDGWTIDAQAQGAVAGLPLGIYASYGVAPKSASSAQADINIYNSSTVDDATAVGFVAKLGVIPGKTQIYAGYGSSDQATKEATITVGVQQMVAQNIKLELYNVQSDTTNKADDYTMLMLFAGF